MYLQMPEGSRAELVEYGRYPDPKSGKRYRTWPPLRLAWWQVVGSGDLKHAEWGVNVEPAWKPGLDIAKYANRVGEYFWRESGKKGYQKTAPEDFGGLRWYGPWGMEPRIVEGELAPEVFVHFRRIERRWSKAKNYGHAVRPPRGIDGTAVFGIDGGIDWTTRALRLCEGLVGEDHRQPLTDRARVRAMQRAVEMSARQADAAYAAERAAEAAHADSLIDAYEREGWL